MRHALSICFSTLHPISPSCISFSPSCIPGAELRDGCKDDTETIKCQANIGLCFVNDFMTDDCQKSCGVCRGDNICTV